MVAHWADRGATSLKAYMHIRRDELRAVVEEAHRRGLKVTGHLCSVSFREAVALVLAHFRVEAAQEAAVLRGEARPDLLRDQVQVGHELGDRRDHLGGEPVAEPADRLLGGGVCPFLVGWRRAWGSRPCNAATWRWSTTSTVVPAGVNATTRRIGFMGNFASAAGDKPGASAARPIEIRAASVVRCKDLMTPICTRVHSSLVAQSCASS